MTHHNVRRHYGMTWFRTLAAVAFAVPTALHAQFRISDALTWADAASGAWSSLIAACPATRTGPGGGAPTTLPGLPQTPGAPRAATWYFAGAIGGGAFHADASGRNSRGAAAAEWRAHWAPQERCRTDLFFTVSGLSNGAATATLEGRYRLAPGNTLAPIIEAFAVPPVGGAGEPDATAVRFGARAAILAPNTYEYTVQPLLRLALGDRSPHLDIKARVFGGWNAFTGDYWMPLPPNPPPGLYGTPAVLRVPWGGGGNFTDVGGTALVSLLHIPVSLIVSSEHVLGGMQPVRHPRARDAIGIAHRLPGHDKNLWLVVRAERLRDLETTTTYGIELAHLLLGSR